MAMNMGLLGNALFGGGQKSTRAVGAPVNTQKSQGGLSAPPRFENAYPNRKTLISTDLIDTPAVTVSSTTKFTEVGAFVVPAQTCVRFGFGQAGGGFEFNQGNLFADLENQAGTDLGGTSVLRFFASNSQGTYKSFFVENTLTRFNQTTPSERLKQPEIDPPIYEDSRIVFELKPAAALTAPSTGLANTESTMEVDVTQYL